MSFYIYGFELGLRNPGKKFFGGYCFSKSLIYNHLFNEEKKGYFLVGTINGIDNNGISPTFKFKALSYGIGGIQH